MPWALVGTTVIATVIYVLMSLSLVLMVTLTVDTDNGHDWNPALTKKDSSFGKAAFSTAFHMRGG